MPDARATAHDYSLYANYPFLSASRDFLNAQKIAPNELLLERARRRVLSLAGKDPTPPARKTYSKESAAEELAVNALAKLLLLSLDSTRPLRAFARAYAKSAARLLEERPQDLPLVAVDLLPSLQRETDNSYSVSLLDFLASSAKPLALEQTQGGRVYLLDGELESLVEEAVRRRVEERPSGFKGAPPLVKKAADALRAELPKEETPLAAQGSQVARACVQRILQGVPEGKRYYGSMALARAAHHDGLSLDAATELMKQYVESCAKGSAPFTLREGMATLNWVYRTGRGTWSCRAIIDEGLESEYCETCPYRRGGRGAQK